MNAKWLVPLAVLFVGAIALASSWPNHASNASRDYELQPTATTATVNPRETLGLDRETSTDLPNGVRLGTSGGFITTVVTDDTVTNKEPWSDLLGTRYTPGSVDDTDVTRQVWRQIKLHLTKPDGSIAKLEIARPLWWFGGEISVGDTIDLTLHELALDGQARVLAISPGEVDSRENTPGSEIVIGTIQHENAVVFDLVFNDTSDKPLGVTANHPIFSHDRNDWVPAGEIKIDEQVEKMGGTATLTSKSQRAGLQTVYNFEVHRSHQYYVSQFAILAHNTGVDCSKLYRVIRSDENPLTGLVAKNPGAKYSAHAHVANGTKLKTQFLSTTKSREVAEFWAKKVGLRIVEIDVRKLGDATLTDLTNPAVRNKLLRHPIPHNFEKDSHEVLLQGIIPPDAMKVIFNPQIPDHT